MILILIIIIINRISSATILLSVLRVNVPVSGAPIHVIMGKKER